MTSSRASSISKRFQFKKSRSVSSGTCSSDSRDSSICGSQLSIPFSINSSYEADVDEEWKGVITAKLFTTPLENRFLCASCLKVLSYPVSLPKCDHHVCSSCLADLCRGKRVCPADGKRFTRDEAMVDEKLQFDLNNLELVCPYKDSGCIWSGRLQNFKDHYDVCDHVEQLCAFGCNFRGPKRSMDAHLSVDCPQRLVTCEFCKRHVRAEMEIEHLKNCPRFPIACPKACGKRDIAREEIGRHLSEECSMADVPCPYNQIGCTFKGGRPALNDHVEECLKQHIKLLCEGVLNHSSLLSTHETNLTNSMQVIAEHENKLSAISDKLGAEMIWKVDEWENKMAQAVSGKKIAIHSPPFYTARHQYKLSLSLLPNGDNKAKGEFVSLYVRVCTGDYDSLLKWPFSHGLDLILVDQSQDPRAKTDFIYNLRPNPCKENLPFLGRPTSRANPAFGPQRFVSHALLNSRDYVRDDVVFIKVCVNSEM
ncbi:unnamed protein product [Clavelina lepadiformis]|uniref:TNF receptor-associated factor 4 n=1 Tax=Clavelina lepadiformis TaxID=159417 RepID=A0ABP0GMB2_CLALP